MSFVRAIVTLIWDDNTETQIPLVPEKYADYIEVSWATRTDRVEVPTAAEEPYHHYVAGDRHHDITLRGREAKLVREVQK